MKLKFLNITLMVVMLSASGLLNSANASIITHGNLTTDTDSNVIIDTQTGRQYLRFDEFDLTYAETLGATSTGGIYEEWNIATVSISDDFIQALFPTNLNNPCITDDVTPIGTECGIISNWVDDSLGFSFNENWDYFAYLNNSLGLNNIGLVQLVDNGVVRDHEQWGSSTTLDEVNSLGDPVHLLLYKDGTEVPEPSTLAICALGVVGLALRRFNKQP